MYFHTLFHPHIFLKNTNNITWTMSSNGPLIFCDIIVATWRNKLGSILFVGFLFDFLGRGVIVKVPNGLIITFMIVATRRNKLGKILLLCYFWLINLFKINQLNICLMFSFSKKLDFMLTTFIKTTKKVKIQNQIKKGKPTFSKNKKIKKR